MNDDRTPKSNEPDDLRSLLGAYALDALDADERAAVEARLLEDQDARAELHALQLGAAWLERSAQRPSPAVWDAVAREMESDLARDAGNPVADAGTRTVTPLRRRPRVVTRTLALAAAFAAVVAVAGGVRTAVDDRIDVGDAALAAVIDVARSEPGARSIVLETANGSPAVEAVVHVDGTGLAVPRDLAPLGARRTYQLWAITADGPVSLGTLGNHQGARTFDAARGASALAITEEPRGGSPEPTGVPIATGDLVTA